VHQPPQDIVHMARLLRAHPLPPQGNTVPGWKPGERIG
jgi:hypothetical protein